MIEKLFRCRHAKCDKAYASEGSLQQHIKLKHSQSIKDSHQGSKSNPDPCIS